MTRWQWKGRTPEGYRLQVGEMYCHTHRVVVTAGTCSQCEPLRQRYPGIRVDYADPYTGDGKRTVADGLREIAEPYKEES